MSSALSVALSLLCRSRSHSCCCSCVCPAEGAVPACGQQRELFRGQAYLVTCVLVLKSNALIDCRTSTQPMYCAGNRKEHMLTKEC